MTKPDLAPFYGAAFGFNTDRRVKPVHFATGFFVALLGRSYAQRILNHTVAFSDGKDLEGEYALDSLYASLKGEKRLSPKIDASGLHALRKHLRCLADNDKAVFPVYGKKPGFGCDYSTATHDVLTRKKDNDGFAGVFVRTMLDQTPEGRQVLDYARSWLTQPSPSLRQLLMPLLEDEHRDEGLDALYEERLGGLDSRRLKRVAKLMAAQTNALVVLCRNGEELLASETMLRFLVVGLCIWLFRYLMKEGLAGAEQDCILLADMLGDTGSRMRAQSRWSYARLREELVAGFARFHTRGRFEDCDGAWQYVREQLDGQPPFEEFYRELALRSGLAQPRASRVAAKHLEPQPDTVRALVLSVLPTVEGPVPITDLLERLHQTWGLCFGGRAEDTALLAQLGYAGLDQDHDLTPNTDALIELRTELGLATRYSDGLIMCHSQPRF